MSSYQVMPPLSDEEYAALRADIAERGVLVPVVRDQHGNLLDGHHRARITTELGIDCPAEVRHVADETEARDVAYTLNLARRHLTREQRRELIAGEIEHRPDDSDRAIARRLGCSPSTVGTVRRGVSNLDTPAMSREEAKAFTAETRKDLVLADFYMACQLANGRPRGELVRELTDAWRNAPADVWSGFVGPRIEGIYAWPNDGMYRLYMLEALTWPEAWKDFDKDTAAWAQAELDSIRGISP